MANEIVVEPRAPAAAAPLPEPETPPAEGEEQSAGLPDEVLQIPVMQGILAGIPPAVSAPLAEFEKRPEAKLIKDHFKGLQQHGIGLYRSLDGGIGVLFNQLKISGDQIKAADQGGQLLSLAPPWDEVNASVGQSGGGNPVLAAGEPTGAATTPPPVPPQIASAPMAGGKPPSAAAQKKTQTARLQSAQPGAPTSGPRPGSGRLLNSIMKPVV